MLKARLTTKIVELLLKILTKYPRFAIFKGMRILLSSILVSYNPHLIVWLCVFRVTVNSYFISVISEQC